MKQITHFLEDESPTLSKKLDCRFYDWSSVTFQKKNERLGARKDKLVGEVSHLSYVKNAAR